MKNEKEKVKLTPKEESALRRILEHLGAQRRAHYHDTAAGGDPNYDPPFVLEDEYFALRTFLRERVEGVPARSPQSLSEDALRLLIKGQEAMIAALARVAKNDGGK